MYEIEIRHRGLNKYRHIKGSDKYIVEQKAHMQQLAWNEMWEKKLLAEGKRVEKEEKNRSREENKELALSRTAEAQNEISEIKNILNHTLRVNDAINWEKLLDRSAFKIKNHLNQGLLNILENLLFQIRNSYQTSVFSIRFSRSANNLN